MKYASCILFAAAMSVASPAFAQYCPSYTPAISTCAITPVAGTNPTTAAWTPIFATAAGGKAAWGTNGPDIGTMGRGCGAPLPSTQVPAHFPCDVLFAIAYQESGWNQFCKPNSPSSQVGKPVRTIVSFDCGYGVGQVTSGMHKGDTAAFDRNRVAAEPLYNLATGTRILRDKWAATGCIGDNLPEVIEHYYYALWAYNGIAYSNNPNNPNKKAGRGVYNPAVNSGSQSLWTYQERLLGMIEYPQGGRWQSQAIAYPNRTAIGTAAGNTTTKLVAIGEPTCASPTDCTNRRGPHTSQCTPPVPPTDAGAPDSGSMDASANDAGNPSDAAPVQDAAPEQDAGEEVPPAESGGCSCTTSGEAPGGLWGGFMPFLGLLAARLRRAATPQRARVSRPNFRP